MPKKTAVTEDVNKKRLAEVQNEAISLKAAMDKRKENWIDFENMVFMDWVDKPADAGIKITIDPGPRNKVNGLSNLLTASRPSWNVPKEKNDPDAESKSSKIEKAANTIWTRSNTVQGKRIERQAIISAAIYDEIHIRIISTKDMLDATKGKMAAQESGENFDIAMAEAEVEQARIINLRTPFLFKLLPPPAVWPLWSSAGPLIVHYTETQMLVADVKNEFGDLAARAIGTLQDYKSVTLCEWWDKVYRYTWLVENKNEPIYSDAHGLNFLPVVSHRVIGSDLFMDVKRQNEPFLYGALKSGVWKAKNQILTALRTNLNALINAGYYYQKQGPDDQLGMINFDQIGNVIQGLGNLQPLAKNIVDQNSTQLWGILDGLFEESTIYGSALGEKLSSNMTFSETALLAQQGRLPIVPQQSALQEVLASVMGVAFRWYKLQGGEHELFGGLTREDIPDIIEFNVVVEPDLPQDKLQQSQVAQAISGGEDPLVPKRWARENVLNESQSDDIQREIWGEQMSTVAFQAGIQETLAMAKQAADTMNAMLTGQGGQQQPQQQQSQQQQPTPEQLQQMMMQQQGGGQMPPEMSEQGGGLPGEETMPSTMPMPPTPGGLR
jgi:hypothetical protein